MVRHTVDLLAGATLGSDEIVVQGVFREGKTVRKRAGTA
jgi:hypothetical protein